MARKAQARPRAKELRKLYKGLLTTSIVHRVEVLKTALQWYDQALEYVKDRHSRKKAWSREQVTSEDKMMKARRLGILSNKQPEKETAFRTAIKIAEGLCAKLHPFLVEKAFAEYELYRQRVEKRRSRLAARYGPVMLMLQAALSPVSSEGEPLRLVVDDVEKARGFSRSGDEFMYSRKAARECQDILRREGLLPLVVQELGPLSRAASMEDDGEGHFKVNLERQEAMLYQLLLNFKKFCMSPDAPRRLVKVGFDGQPRAVRKGTGGGFGKAREKIDGLYAVGSGIGLLYARLKEGNWEDIAALQKMTSANVRSRLEAIEREGHNRGWKLEWNEDQVRMVKEA